MSSFSLLKPLTINDTVQVALLQQYAIYARVTGHSYDLYFLLVNSRLAKLPYQLARVPQPANQRQQLEIFG